MLGLRGQCTSAGERAQWSIEGTGKRWSVSTYLSPVVIDNDGTLLIIDGDCAHITLPWGHRTVKFQMGDGCSNLFRLICSSLGSFQHYTITLCNNSSVPSESTDAVRSMSPARAIAREDFPTPFWPSRAILKGPSALASTVTVKVSSKAGLKLTGEAEGPAAPEVHSHSSWTASSRLSWCLIGRGVLPLRTVGVLDRVILSHWGRDGNRLYHFSLNLTNNIEIYCQNILFTLKQKDHVTFWIYDQSITPMD